MAAKKTIAERRALYYKKIKQYEERRKQYYKYVRHSTQKIAGFKRQIRRIDSRTEEVTRIGKAVKEFTGISIKRVRRNTNPKYNIPKYFFYKYGLEAGFNQVYLQNYTGTIDQGTPSRNRITLNRLLRTDPYIKQQWEAFKKFINESYSS
jgi:hypothetical protein